MMWVRRELSAYFESCPQGQQAYGVVVPEEGAAGNDWMASSVWIPLSRIDAALGVGETSWLVHWEVRPLYSFTRDDLREEKSIVGLRNKAGNEHEHVESQKTGLGGTLLFLFTSAHPKGEPVPPILPQPAGHPAFYGVLNTSPDCSPSPAICSSQPFTTLHTWKLLLKFDLVLLLR